MEDATRLLEGAALIPNYEPPLGAQVARLVACAPFPPRAVEVGDRLGISTQKAASLLRPAIFTRLVDGRYLLGSGYAQAAAHLSGSEISSV